MIARRFRFSYASSGPAVVADGALWVALMGLPMKLRSDTQPPGHLLKIDLGTGAVRGDWDIGNYPSGITASGHHIWIATTRGDIHEPIREPNVVTERTRDGILLRRYHVMYPTAITPAPDGVWVTGFTGRDGVQLRHLHDGRTDPPVTVDPAASGMGSLAACPDGIYVPVLRTGPSVAITRFSRAGTHPRTTDLSVVGATVTCAAHGAVVGGVDDGADDDQIIHVTAQARVATRATIPRAPILALARSKNRIWALSTPDYSNHSTLTPIDPHSGAPGTPTPIPRANFITADGDRIWAIGSGRITEIAIR